RRIARQGRGACGERTNEATGARDGPWFVRSPSGKSSTGRRGLTGRLVRCSFLHSLPFFTLREDIVVAGGGVVVLEDGQDQIQRAQVVDAAAHALAGLAA